MFHTRTHHNHLDHYPDHDPDQDQYPDLDPASDQDLDLDLDLDQESDPDLEIDHTSLLYLDLCVIWILYTFSPINSSNLYNFTVGSMSQPYDRLRTTYPDRSFQWPES